MVEPESASITVARPDSRRLHARSERSLHLFVVVDETTTSGASTAPQNPTPLTPHRGLGMRRLCEAEPIE